MLRQLLLILYVSAFVTSLGGCIGGIGFAYEDDLVGDYAVWALDLTTQAAVVRKRKKSSSASVIIKKMVFAYGWNNEFIIAKQHPQKRDNHWEIDSSVTNWFILQVHSGTVHGPMNEDEFNETRIHLGVPPELSFTKIIDP